METKLEYQRFVDKFVLEIILYLKEKQKEASLEKKEDMRRLKAVEVGKLKKKFESYAEKTPVLKISAPQKEIIKTEIKKEMVIRKPIPAQPRAKPIPTPKKMPSRELNGLEKIDLLIKDPLITYIECPGENKEISVKKAGARVLTKIKLSAQGIADIIKYFADMARMPLVKGVFNARVENLEIIASIPETGSSSFVIKKILIQIIPQGPTILDRSMMKFPSSPQPSMPMPPMNRPFVLPR